MRRMKFLSTGQKDFTFTKFRVAEILLENYTIKKCPPVVYSITEPIVALQTPPAEESLTRKLKC